MIKFSEQYQYSDLQNNPLPEDIKHTKERKQDLLKKVTDKTGKTFVLNIEYQAESDQEMTYRMAEYSIMLKRKSNLPLKQYVIFIGRGKANIATNNFTEDFKFRNNMTSLLISATARKLAVITWNMIAKLLHSNRKKIMSF
ncbi:MAG: hypothetical protein ACMG51_03380 [Ginsengibacter sp.]